MPDLWLPVSAASAPAHTSTRTNYATAPQQPGGGPTTGCWSWINNWAGTGSTASVVTGATDGPTPAITAYRRKTWTVVGSNTSEVGWTFGSDGAGGAPVVPGETYTVSVYARCSREQAAANGGTRRRLMVARFSDASGVQVGADVQMPDVPGVWAAGTWIRPSASFTVPAGAAYVKVWAAIWLEGIQVGDTLDGTGLLVERGAPTGDPIRANLCTNPSAETDLTGFSAGSWGTSGAGTVSRVTTGGVSGSAFARMAWTTAATGGTPYANLIATPRLVPVTAGGTYTASCYVRCSRAVTARVVLIGHTDASGSGWLGFPNAQGGGNPTFTIPANTWTRVSMTGIAPSTATHMRFLVELQSVAMAVGDTYDVDAVLVEQGATLGAFFDGSFYGAAWTGTAHASTSTLRAVTTPDVGTFFDGSTPSTADVVRAWTGTANASTSTEVTTLAPAVTWSPPDPLAAATRVESWWVDVLGPYGAVAGQLDGLTGGRVDADADRLLHTGGRLDVDDIGQGIDWLDLQVRIWWQVAGADPWPLATLVCSAPSDAHTEVGRAWSVDLLDRLSILDADGLPATYSLPAGTVVTTAVRDLLVAAGHSAALAITDSAETLPAGLVWEAGTSRLRVINDLLDAAGYFALHTDPWGRFVAAPYVAPGDRAPVRDLTADAIVAHDWTRDQDLSAVPNRVVLVGRGTTDTEALVAVAENNDPASRLSIPRRGRVITHTDTGVEATSQAVLAALAARKLVDLSTPSATRDIDHAPVPLRLHDVVVHEGVRAAVQDWSLSLAVGADMRTGLREVVL